MSRPYPISAKFGSNLLLLLISAFSHQGSPHQIFHIQLLLSSVSSSVTSTSAMSSFTTSINLLFGLPRFLLLATPSSASISQDTHHLSSIHVHTTSVSPLVFSLQTVPPVLSLWCTHSWFCPFLSLLMKIVTSSTLTPPSPPPVFSSVPPSPTRTTLLVSLPPCTPSLSL